MKKVIYLTLMIIGFINANSQEYKIDTVTNCSDFTYVNDQAEDILNLLETKDTLTLKAKYWNNEQVKDYMDKALRENLEWSSKIMQEYGIRDYELQRYRIDISADQVLPSSHHELVHAHYKFIDKKGNEEGVISMTFRVIGNNKALLTKISFHRREPSKNIENQINNVMQQYYESENK